MIEQSPKPFEVTNRVVLSIAVPMTLAYLTTPLLGIVGTAVVGQFGSAALLGGLAAGAIVFDVVFTTFNFLRSGTTGLVSQAFGRDDPAEEQAIFWRAFAIALTSGLILAVAAPLVADAGRWFIGADAAVSEALETYVRVRMLGAPFALINYAVLGYVLGRGEATLGLALQILLNGLNIILALIFGLYWGWGVAGVAWAVVCGEGVAACVGMIIVMHRFRQQAPLEKGALLNATAFRRMLSLNRDIMIRSFSLLAAFALFTRQGAQFGTVTLAANAVLMNFFLVGGFFLDGFANAAEQLAGRAVGARYAPAFRAALRLTTIWGFVLAALATTVFLIFGPALVETITTSTDVRLAADQFLVWAAFTAVTGVLAFQMDGVFIGATWSSDMRNMMVLSLVVFVAALEILTTVFGNHGLWAALHIFLLTRGVSLLCVLPARARAVFTR
ncbi:MAG: MATE family efflux transporter [Rhizobiaceae bacterium]